MGQGKVLEKWQSSAEVWWMTGGLGGALCVRMQILGLLLSKNKKIYIYINFGCHMTCGNSSFWKLLPENILLRFHGKEENSNVHCSCNPYFFSPCASSLTSSDCSWMPEVVSLCRCVASHKKRLPTTGTGKYSVFNGSLIPVLFQNASCWNWQLGGGVGGGVGCQQVVLVSINVLTPRYSYNYFDLNIDWHLVSNNKEHFLMTTHLHTLKYFSSFEKVTEGYTYFKYGW